MRLSKVIFIFKKTNHKTNDFSEFNTETKNQSKKRTNTKHSLLQTCQRLPAQAFSAGLGSNCDERFCSACGFYRINVASRFFKLNRSLEYINLFLFKLVKLMWLRLLGNAQYLIRSTLKRNDVTRNNSYKGLSKWSCGRNSKIFAP